MKSTKRQRNSRAAAENERMVARALGAVRVARRGSYRKEQDVSTIDARGVRLCPEAKLRASAKALTAWLNQADGYSAGAPLVVLRVRNGGEAIAILRLATFVEIAGIEPMELPTKHKVTKRNPKQTELFE